MPGVNAVVLVPIKAFTDAKARLAGVLGSEHREQLARWMADAGRGGRRGTAVLRRL